MKLRMLTSFDGTHDGLPWPEIGGIVEIEHPQVIADLVRNGYAEIVAEPKPAKVETAEAAGPKATAAARTGKTKPRAKS